MWPKKTTPEPVEPVTSAGQTAGGVVRLSPSLTKTPTVSVLDVPRACRVVPIRAPAFCAVTDGT